LEGRTGTVCLWPFSSGLELEFNLNFINIRNLVQQPDSLI
jgi:hypothetical protein